MPLTNLTAQDFLLGTWQHYPVEVSESGSANVDIAPVVRTFIREGSPDGVRPGKITWLTYPGSQSGWQMNGEGLDWTEITEAPDGTALVTSFSYDLRFGLLTGMSQPYSQAGRHRGHQKLHLGVRLDCG